MNTKKYGERTIALACPPSVLSAACTGGKMEGDGPLGRCFDQIYEDSFFGEKTWEKAESTMQRITLDAAVKKASLSVPDIECVFAGDLLNQCIGSSFGLREMGVPFWGVYGACSTMAETLALGSMAIDGGFFERVACVTSSHYCAAERQFRMPLEYGGQRTPTAQWTVTASAAVLLGMDGGGPYVTHFTVGKIIDRGIKDANNMGAAMAPAAHDTISAHFRDLAVQPDKYDLIVTGDLGAYGAEIASDLLAGDGYDISGRYNDCGVMIYDRDRQDVHAGGSGCGCAGSVLAGHIIPGMRDGKWENVLFCATGAMLSTLTTQQGESIPGICCAIAFSNKRG